MCHASGGQYLDGSNAEISGKAVPIGIDNRSFTKALKGQMDRGRFVSFVIDEPCETVKRKVELPYDDLPLSCFVH
jgi:hypothetical protein